jgi:hypothetical protein
VEPTYSDYLLTSFYDDIANQSIIKQPKFETTLKNLHVTLPEYNHLFSPAFEWELMCIGHFATQVLSCVKYP